MKRLRSQGVGVKRKRAEPISIEEDEILWEKGLLGEDSPKVLLDVMIYLCGVHFTLRSGQEHRSLQRNHIELIKQIFLTLSTLRICPRITVVACHIERLNLNKLFTTAIKTILNDVWLTYSRFIFITVQVLLKLHST